MKPKYKLILILSSICLLDAYMGFDLRFTLINLAWCIPIVYDWFKEMDDKLDELDK